MTSSDLPAERETAPIWSPYEIWILGVISAVDVGIVAFWIVGLMSAAQGLLTHALTVLFLLLARLLFVKDRPRVAAMALLHTLIGPLGCPTLFVAQKWPGVPVPLQFSEESSNVTRQRRPDAICNAIRQNRRHHPVEGTLQNFQRVIRSGSSRDHQAAIAAILRQYSPEMRPALDLALRSPNAALRVQAAAVFAKLRSSFSDRTTDAFLALQEGRRGAAAAELAAEARAVGNSGFVGEDQRRHLLAAARLLERRANGKSSDAAKVASSTPRRARPSDIKRYSCGGMA